MKARYRHSDSSHLTLTLNKKILGKVIEITTDEGEKGRALIDNFNQITLCGKKCNAIDDESVSHNCKVFHLSYILNE
jgi:hypothetical protein